VPGLNSNTSYVCVDKAWYLIVARFTVMKAIVGTASSAFVELPLWKKQFDLVAWGVANWIPRWTRAKSGTPTGRSSLQAMQKRPRRTRQARVNFVAERERRIGVKPTEASAAYNAPYERARKNKSSYN
jgi:hypothetical protein